MDYYEEFDESLEIVSLVESMKAILEIDKPNSEMSDAEIKAVAREIGKLSEDTILGENGEPIYGKEGIYWMIEICLFVFPRYWEKMGLAQFN